MGNRSFFILCILALGLACNKQTTDVVEQKAPKPGIYFFEDQYFVDMVDLAKRENKKVFVDFEADWCLPCKVMEEEIYSDAKVGDYFNRHFINFKVDIESEKGANIASVFNVYALPTLVFVDNNGSTIKRIEGSISYSELLASAEEVLADQVVE